MNTAAQYLEELTAEAAKSKKMLELVPADQLTWKPHEKSMAIGRLAMHIAELPGWMGTIINSSEMDFNPKDFKPNVPDTKEDILNEFESRLAKGKAVLSETDNQQLDEIWKMKVNGKVVLEDNKNNLIRRELNHIVHHRGQLSVFLRLLDVPLPGTFGPTADGM